MARHRLARYRPRLSYKLVTDALIVRRAVGRPEMEDVIGSRLADQVEDFLPPLRLHGSHYRGPPKSALRCVAYREFRRRDGRAPCIQQDMLES